MTIRFKPTVLTRSERELQRSVREFLADALPKGSRTPSLGISGESDPAFSRKLAKRGWVGMALPEEYGGRARSAVERFVVVEELLRWGAPVGHHWVGDRQTGPLILKFGTEAQKRRFLPQICAAEVTFCIGMSEPDSGSDLASVRTRAERVDGGWLVSGTKVWTSGAHYSDWMLTLCRSTPGSSRHEGLSQLLVDLRGPGLEVRPIPFLNGDSHFNEVVLSEAFVPDELVLGRPGDGWAQNSSELAYERGGPDRWITPLVVAEQMLREQTTEPSAHMAESLGASAARWWAIRQMSLSVARLIDTRGAPAVEAALVKDLGTRFEQVMIAELKRLSGRSLVMESDSLLDRLLADAVLTGPSFTIRGGTNEVLTGVIVKGMSK